MLLALRSLWESSGAAITGDAASGQAGQTEAAALLLAITEAGSSAQAVQTEDAAALQTIAESGTSAQGQEADGASAQSNAGTGASADGGQTGASIGAEAIASNATSVQGGQESGGLATAVVSAAAASSQGNQSSTGNDLQPVDGDATSGQGGQGGDALLDQQQVGQAIMFMDSVDSRPRRKRRIDPRYDERFYPDEDDALATITGEAQSGRGAGQGAGNATCNVATIIHLRSPGSLGSGAAEFTAEPSDDEWMLILAEAA